MKENSSKISQEIHINSNMSTKDLERFGYKTLIKGGTRGTLISLSKKSQKRSRVSLIYRRVLLEPQDV